MMGRVSIDGTLAGIRVAGVLVPTGLWRPKLFRSVFGNSWNKTGPFISSTF